MFGAHIDKKARKSNEIERKGNKKKDYV